MKIEYRLDDRDWRRFLIFRARRSPALVRIYRLAGCFGLGLIGAGLLAWSQGLTAGEGFLLKDLWLQAGRTMTIAGGFLGSAFLLIYFLVPAQEAGDPAYRERCGLYELEINDQGLTWSSADRVLRLKWRRITGRCEHQNFLYIFYDAVNAVVVPLAELGPAGREKIFRPPADSEGAAHGREGGEAQPGRAGLKYTLDKKDWRRLAADRARDMRPVKFDVRLLRAVLAASYFLMFYRELKIGWAGGGFGLRPWLGAAVTAALIWRAPGLTKWFMGLGGRLAADLRGARPEDHELELGDEGLVDRVDGRELELKWPRLKKLAAGRELIVITALGREAVVVPGRAFRDEAARRDFLGRLSAASGRPVEDRAAAPPAA